MSDVFNSPSPPSDDESNFSEPTTKKSKTSSTSSSSSKSKSKSKPKKSKSLPQHVDDSSGADDKEDASDEEYQQPDIPDSSDSDSDSNSNDATKRTQHNKAGKAAEAGIIVKVYVENFMCHKKLTLDLCPNVNFINGSNGSGKSAILAAIQICLGAQARRTGRAKVSEP